MSPVVNDDNILSAINLLDRINRLQHLRHYGDLTDDQLPVIWHRPEDIMHALATIDMFKTRAVLDQQLAMVEQRMRSAGYEIPQGKKLDG